MRNGNYVKAKDLPSQGITPREADLWVSYQSERDEAQPPFYTIEIAPQYGAVTAVKFSTEELMEVWELIGERLMIDGKQASVTIEAPMAMTVNVVRT